MKTNVYLATSVNGMISNSRNVPDWLSQPLSNQALRFLGNAAVAYGSMLIASVAGGSFACAMQLDLTIKGHGRMSLNELCIYEVKDGKVISEQFTSRFHV